MAKSKGNYEYDSSESDDDSSDDNAPIQPQKVNPKIEKNGVNEKASGSSSNNATAFSKSANPKIHPAVKSIPFNPIQIKPPRAKAVVQASSEDGEEDETDSDDDIAEVQKPKNGGVAKNTVNRQSSAVSNNSKIYPAVKSIPFKPAITKSSNAGRMVKTSSEEEDETDSSLDYDDDDKIRPEKDKNTVARQASKASATSNNSKIHPAVKSIPFKSATELKTAKTVTVSSEDESDPTSSDDEVNEVAVSKLPPKINNGTTNNTFVSSSSKIQNNVKAANKTFVEESDETSDTSESNKTSSEDNDDDDASDEEEEEDETEDKQNLPLKNAPGHAVKKPENTVTQSNPATFTLSKNDETDEDYTSSEDEVFAHKPLTAKPFQTDSESEEPDYSDDSSEDDMIPLKNNQNIASKNVITPKDIGASPLPKHQPKIAAPFQTTSIVYQSTSQKPTVYKHTNTVAPVSHGSTSSITKQQPKVTVPFQNPFPPVLSAATVSRASIQPISSVTRQQLTVSSNIKITQKTSEEDDLLLNALQQFSLNLSNPEERQKELERRAEEALRRNELTFVCCVCFENYYRSSNFVKCKKLNGEKTKHDHYICITCLRGTATPENAGIAPDGSGLKCPFQECQNILLMSEIRGLIDAGVEANLLDLIGRMSLASADIGILVTCPGCQKQWIVEDKGKPSYDCECKRKNCLFCEREYDKFHEGRNCQEAAAAAAAEIKTKKQNEVALEMNNIIVRVCHKCGLQFVKSEGCNKMTCRCKATQCYICRERDVDYGHFGGPCQLYDDAEAYDRRRLEEVIAKNKNAPM